jgi:hypothetical protein
MLEEILPDSSNWLTNFLIKSKTRQYVGGQLNRFELKLTRRSNAPETHAYILTYTDNMC